MKHKALNLASTIGILIAFVLSIFTTNEKVTGISLLIIFLLFILMLINAYVNKNPDHLNAMLFFNLGKEKKVEKDEVDNDGGFDD